MIFGIIRCDFPDVVKGISLVKSRMTFVCCVKMVFFCL